MLRPPFAPLCRAAVIALCLGSLGCGAEGPDTGAAEWIWAERSVRHATPGAFCAVRDFVLPTLPEEIHLLITADEEYRVTINAHGVGAGYRPAGSTMELDRYDVTPYLLAGGNRIVVELRHSWGQGGFLLLLRDGDGRDLLTTDTRWQITETLHRGLPEGWAPLLDAQPAIRWGRPPTGRWGHLGSTREGHAIPEKATLAPVEEIPGASPAARTFDWGEIVCGYLRLAFAPEEEHVLAVLYLGETLETLPPHQRFAVPLPVLRLPGSDSWWSTAPFCFRYARLYGVAASATLAPINPADPVDAAPLPRPVAGLLGITPPAQRTPVLFAVRQRLRGTLDGLEIGADPDAI